MGVDSIDHVCSSFGARKLTEYVQLLIVIGLWNLENLHSKIEYCSFLSSLTVFEGEYLIKYKVWTNFLFEFERKDLIRIGKGFMYV